MITTYKIALSTLLLVLAFGCGDMIGDEDKTIVNDDIKPTIFIQSINPEMIVDSVCSTVSNRTVKVKTDSTLQIKIVFQDNHALSQYKIDVHNNFDCHVHPRSNPWRVLKVVDIQGKKIEVVETFTIPSDASTGNYHFLILCLDSLGNEAEFVEYDIKIENALDNKGPIIDLQNPTTDTLLLNKSESLLLEATIRDNFSLKNGRIELVYFNEANEEFTALQLFFEPSTEKEYKLKTSFKLPPSAPAGLYKFIFKVFDQANNESQKIFFAITS